jgi:hypothetical protein
MSDEAYATVAFGNLTVRDFEKLANIKLSDEDYALLEGYRNNGANDSLIGKLHIFAIPFRIDCGEDIFQTVLGILYKYDFSKSPVFGVGSFENERL